MDGCGQVWMGVDGCGWVLWSSEGEEQSLVEMIETVAQEGAFQAHVKHKQDFGRQRAF